MGVAEMSSRGYGVAEMGVAEMGVAEVSGYRFTVLAATRIKSQSFVGLVDEKLDRFSGAPPPKIT